MLHIILKTINVGGIRSKARDGQRQGDLKKIQIALEDYYSDFREYPDTLSNWIRITGTDTLSNTLITNGYLQLAVVDPVGLGNTTGTSPCDATLDYFYMSDGIVYTLSSNMEVDTSSSDHPCTLLGLCGGSPPNECYAVDNP